MPGPPPKDPAQRRRRNRPAEVTTLPAEGRQGRAPAWPLSKMVAGELAAWRDAWATPQAVAWEQLGWTRVVARYVRVLVAAELPGANAQVLSECRQMEDRLGLSPMAMRRLQWKVAGEDEAPAADLAAVVTPDRWRRSGVS